MTHDWLAKAWQIALKEQCAALEIIITRNI